MAAGGRVNSGKKLSGAGDGPNLGAAGGFCRLVSRLAAGLVSRLAALFGVFVVLIMVVKSPITGINNIKTVVLKVAFFKTYKLWY